MSAAPALLWSPFLAFASGGVGSDAIARATRAFATNLLSE